MVKQTSNLQTMYLVYKQNVGYKFPSVMHGQTNIKFTNNVFGIQTKCRLQIPECLFVWETLHIKICMARKL